MTTSSVGQHQPMLRWRPKTASSFADVVLAERPVSRCDPGESHSASTKSDPVSAEPTAPTKIFCIIRKLRPHDDQPTEFAYPEFSGLGPPAVKFGGPGDTYIDLAEDPSALYGKTLAGWRKWTSPNQKDHVLIEHPSFPDFFLWARVSSGSAGWFRKSAIYYLSRDLPTSAAGRVLSSRQQRCDRRAEFSADGLSLPEVSDCIIRKLRPYEDQPTEIAYPEFSGFGPPLLNFGDAGDTYIDLTQDASALYGKTSAGWMKWTSPNQKDPALIEHPTFPDFILWVQASSGSAGWFKKNAIRYPSE
ncbi:hypothetical protein C8J56DRAFT_398587 [Mycena floridula]|nr:hypothetical protein C8J56DRAFT_398587 [Mycena floridula]